MAEDELAPSPATSAAIMTDGIDDVEFPSGFHERRGPGLFEVSFRDRDDARRVLPSLATFFGVPSSLIFALRGEDVFVFAIIAIVLALWVRASVMRVSITVERQTITMRHSLLGPRCSIVGSPLVEVRGDPWRVVAIVNGREHTLAAGITEKQANVLRVRILRALYPTTFSP